MIWIDRINGRKCAKRPEDYSTKWLWKPDIEWILRTVYQPKRKRWNWKRLSDTLCIYTYTNTYR